MGHLHVLLVLNGVLLLPGINAKPIGEKDVIVQLFQWNWRSIARECTEFLGPKGYAAVQISPPHEHVIKERHPWWQDYQVASYKLDKTRRGTKADLKAMVDACHKAGVKIYVDAVINHMSGMSNGTGSAGSTFTRYDYPGTYQGQDFHHCGRNRDESIVNFRDRWEVQQCQLVGLADLKTETDYVRGRIAAYMNDLKSDGVDGFRLDASKHMAKEDIAAIMAKVNPTYCYQEVIWGAGEPIAPEEYVGNGDVLEFRYGNDLAKIFNREKLAYLKTFASPLSSGKAVVFTDNHDTQRSSNVLTFRDNGKYALANAFMLAWPYGTPKVMSSYDFTSFDDGPPSTEDGTTLDTTCFENRWRCEHRWRVIANMIGFHNAVRGTEVTDWWDNGNNAIAFGRGKKGFLIINNEDSSLAGRSFHTTLPQGDYCDVFHGDYVSGNCSGPYVSVKADGWFQANIPAHDGLALHVMARRKSGH